MHKTLNGYSLMITLLLCTLGVSALASTSAITDTVFTTLDKPVAHFKTTGKDPYLMVHRPSTNTLETVIFGYYTGNGVHAKHITQPSEQLEFMIPIRWTTLCGDAPVQIDVKGTGYRESVIGIAAEDFFKAVGLLPDHYYKGIPLVDQYVEGIPMKWVFNKAAELTSLRRYLEPMLERVQSLENCIAKPALIISIEGAKHEISQEDADFLNKYFTLVGPTDRAVKLFFDDHQKQINLVVMKDGKRVKETFFEMLFHGVEKATNEGKAKELGVVVISAVISAITVGVLQEYVREITKDLTKHAKIHGDKKVINPVGEHLNENHDLRNGLLILGGALTATVVGTAALSAATE